MRFVLCLIVLCSTPAVAQQPLQELRLPQSDKPLGEVVVGSDGNLTSPWQLKRLCSVATQQCENAIVHPETGEVAKVGARWSSGFRSTGSGVEVRRLREGLLRREVGRSAKEKLSIAPP
jgi:hypothetical protein